MMYCNSFKTTVSKIFLEGFSNAKYHLYHAVRCVNIHVDLSQVKV